MKKWAKEACYEEAKKYKSRSEFQKKKHRAYDAACKYGILDQCTWFNSKRNKKGTWTYEKCKEVSMQFDNITDFYRTFPGAYSSSNRNGWIEDFNWLKRKDNIYKSNRDNVYAYFFNEFNSVYIGRSVEPEVRNIKHKTDKRSTVFKFAKKNEIQIPEMTILENGLTLEEGLKKEDYYVKKYREEGWNVLNKAKTGIRSGALGTLNNCKWNKKTCCEESKKYNNKTDFKNKSGRAYEKARKNGWLDEYTWLKDKRRA